MCRSINFSAAAVRSYSPLPPSVAEGSVLASPAWYVSKPCSTGPNPGAADVPFADGGGRVAGLLEIVADHFLFERHLHFDFRVEQFLRGRIGPTGQERGQVEASRRLAGKNRSSRGRADRLGAVGRSEPHALLRKVVEVWRMMILPPVAMQIIDAQVVAEDE